MVLIPLESFNTEAAEHRWPDYTRVKDEWNVALGGYRSKIKVLIDADLAYKLLDKKNGENYQDKSSLHSLFVVAHYKLKDLMEYTGSDLERRRKIEIEALAALDELADALDTFSEDCYTAYLSQYSMFKESCE